MKIILLLWIPCLLFGEVDHALISAYAVDSATGEVLINWEGEKSLMPASCLKVITTGAALHKLGPDYRFNTDLEIEGGIIEGVLRGNVVIRGGGDPCLGSDRVSTSLSWERQLEVWADAIEARGIREIEGKIIGDTSLWDSTQAAPSWAWEDLGNYYGAGALALSFHENMTTVTFKPGKHPGAPAILVDVVPASHDYVLKSEVITGPEGSGDRACIYGSELSMTHYVRGTIPAGVDSFSIKGSIPNPPQLCSDLLQQTLEKKGIQIRGEMRERSDTKEVIHRTYSPKVREIVYWTHQKSINLYAEHLIKAMGKGNSDAGVQSVVDFWRTCGMSKRGFNMVDGSGLSRKNFVTAQQLTQVFVEMKKSPHFEDFYASLPEYTPGIRGKTGSMSFTRGLVGYKGDVAFAILINNCQNSSEMKNKIEQFIKKLPNTR